MNYFFIFLFILIQTFQYLFHILLDRKSSISYKGKMNIAIKVSRYFGGVRKMANEMGCSTQYIYQWPNNKAPKTASYQLEVMTKGFFSAVNLMDGVLPDVIIKNGHYLNS